MNNYRVISGVVFAIVALAHLLRIIDGWVITVNGQVAPMYISYLGFAVTGMLAIWAFKSK
ncbi:MAG: hypothetical protein FE834_07770 [Gammaproteobacteria bacterium]|uniref:Uncharacterized protein n=1 Tax=hydrothermal vent metagenome TaxID=652676 RepID=A0A1W1E3Z7_9ZZZZ|nr:hypothetical protein [Gammaproteobacteria bacterium]